MINESNMRKTFLPKTIRWTLLLGFSFLIIMSLLRYIFVNRFAAPASSDNNLTASYILGLRYYFSILLYKAIQPISYKIRKANSCHYLDAI
jgi:hypothetical protein